jgi:hypothetical protein
VVDDGSTQIILLMSCIDYIKDNRFQLPQRPDNEKKKGPKILVEIMV